MFGRNTVQGYEEDMAQGYSPLKKLAWEAEADVLKGPACKANRTDSLLPVAEFLAPRKINLSAMLDSYIYIERGIYTSKG